uniref:Uncharacterized protein n=1 Tax=Rhizophora mucronata TaxID=61149 RepID=A0A2P2PRH8_RHIMU
MPKLTFCAVLFGERRFQMKKRIKDLCHGSLLNSVRKNGVKKSEIIIPTTHSTRYLQLKESIKITAEK